jgi:acetyltransferase-like isoleucine patch superfamily enzyme
MTPGLVRRALKWLAARLALAAAWPAVLTCRIEARVRPGAEGVFETWTHVFAILPGRPGMYLRRAFYMGALRYCAPDCYIGFGVLFAHREARVEEGVQIGPYAVIGMAHLRSGTLVGTRASLLSGSAQHEWRPEGGWSPSDLSQFTRIEVGPHAWIGEAAVVMADVGPESVVAAGAVVSSPLPAGVVMAGNPARFVRKRFAEAPRGSGVADGVEGVA